MPFRAPSICRCGRAIPPGQRCACKIIEDRERERAHDRKRGNAAQRGYDKDWRLERAAFLKLSPKCKFCGSPANVVDHVIPHKGDKKLFWDRSNWQSLCTPCHSRIKQAIERGWRK